MRRREWIWRKRKTKRKALERNLFDGVRRVGLSGALERFRVDARSFRAVFFDESRRLRSPNRVDACFSNIRDGKRLRLARDRLRLARKSLSAPEIGVSSARSFGVVSALGDGGGRRGVRGDRERNDRRRIEFGVCNRLRDGCLCLLRRRRSGFFRSALGRDRRERLAARVRKRRDVVERKKVAGRRRDV